MKNKLFIQQASIGTVEEFSLSEILTSDSDEIGHCVSYGQCGVDPRSNMPLACEYSGPPKPLTNQTVLETLYSFCPQYVNVSDNGINLFNFHRSFNSNL